MPGSLEDKSILADINIIGTSAISSNYLDSGDLQILLSKDSINDNKLYVYMAGSSQTPSAVATSASFRYGVTYDKVLTTLKAFEDGVLIGTDSSAAASLTADATISFTSGNDAFYHISNFRIYDIALSEEEMKIA